jgi:hypothetical protein
MTTCSSMTPPSKQTRLRPQPTKPSQQHRPNLHCSNRRQALTTSNPPPRPRITQRLPTLNPEVSEEKFNRQRTRTDVRRGGQGPCQLARRTSEASNSSWGSGIDLKSDGSFRYCFLNICGLPMDALHEKYQLLTKCMQKTQ